MKSGFERIGHTVTIEQAHRACLDKVRYAGRNEARDAVAYLGKKYNDGVTLRPYRCTLCGGFHLTSKTPNGLRKGKPLAEAGRERKRA